MNKNKKKVLAIILGVLLVVVAVVVAFLFLKKDKKEEKDVKDTTTTVPQIVLNRTNGTPKYIDGSVVRTKVDSEEDVFEALDEVSEMYGFTDPQREFNILTTNANKDFTYYKLRQKYSNIEVYGHEIVVAVDKENKVTSLSGNYFPKLSLSTYYSTSEETAKETLTNRFGENYEILESKKYIYIKEDQPYLTYMFKVMDLNGSELIFISGKDGSIVDTIANNAAATEYKGVGADGKEYTINLEQSGEIYSFYDTSRNIQIIDAYSVGMDFGSKEDVKWGNLLYYLYHNNLSQVPIRGVMKDGTLAYPIFNGTGAIVGYDSADKIQNAVSTMANFAYVYDYYQDKLGRKSFDNNGGKIVVNIGVGQNALQGSSKDNEWFNASYVSGPFYIGSHNGMPMSIALDVIAHEFTHGVVEYTAGLEYKGESGALNESYADIFGSIIENKNFQLGESVEEIRDMTDPNKYGDPFKKDGKFFFPTDEETYTEEWRTDLMKRAAAAGSPLSVWTDYDNGGVHINSGVSNYAAYKMYEDGAFKDKDEMAQVYYNSLFLMTSTSDFEDCALAVIQSAKSLGLAEDKIKIITDAFVETNMLALDTAVLSGKVEDGNSHEALEGVTVTAIHKLNAYVNYETTTNANGEYKFENLPATDYIISFEKGKYKTEEKDIYLTADTLDFNASLSKIDQSNAKESEIVFVMDISESMDSSDPDDIRKQIISNVLASLDNDANVALITFAGNAKVVNDGLSNKNVDRKILVTDIFNITNDDGYGSDSGTNGRAGIEKALSLFTSRTDVRRYIVFLTDGIDNRYDGKSYEELIEMANKRNIRILTIGLGSDNDINEEQLQTIATETSGKYYHATKSSKLYKFDKRIFEELE